MKKLIILVLFTMNSLLVPVAIANDDSCYQISDSSDRAACLGHAYSTNNEDARNIILDNCYSLSRDARNNGLREVCANGRSGCYSLKDSDAMSACVSCNGSNKWARMYAVGYQMSCY